MLVVYWVFFKFYFVAFGIDCVYVGNCYLALDLQSRDLCREQVGMDFECAIHPEVTLCL